MNIFPAGDGGHHIPQQGEALRNDLAKHLSSFAAVGFSQQTGLPILIVNVDQKPSEIIAIKSMLSDCAKTLDSIMQATVAQIEAGQAYPQHPPQEDDLGEDRGGAAPFIGG